MRSRRTLGLCPATAILVLVLASVLAFNSRAATACNAPSSMKAVFGDYPEIEPSYGSVRYYTTLAVYYVGKPAHSAQEVTKARYDDFLAGAAVGGLKGAVANVIKEQGIDAGIRILHRLASSAPDVAREYSKKAMSLGIDSLKENYALIGNRASITPKEFALFLENHRRVALLGASKTLYLRSTEDLSGSENIRPSSEMAKSIATLHQALTASKVAVATMDILTIAERLQGLEQVLDAYQPFKDYLSVVGQVPYISFDDYCGSAADLNRPVYSPPVIHLDFDGTIPNTAIWHGSRPSYREGVSGRSAHFDGKNGYLELGKIFPIGASDFSISMWVKFERQDGDEQFLDTGNQGESALIGLTYSNGSQNRIRLVTQKRLKNGKIESDNHYTKGEYGTQRWIHLVVTRTAGDGEIYVNGERVDEGYQGGIDRTKSDVLAGDLGDGVWRLGYGHQASKVGRNLFQGNIDELSIYDRVLNGAEITRIYRDASPQR